MANDPLDAAKTLEDVRIPPGNKLKSLSGELKGFYSIRINDQWRIVFKWGLKGPEHVKIIDYR